ncbi:MAG: putative oxidoreductase [Ilumatobacteraceae bacterium]|nr:putative oxidoreductase [Ilumatobacteraceae bacterium]
MTREFADRPIDPALLDDLVDLATRAPSPGKTQGWHLVVLSGAETARFWDATMAPERRAGFRWQGLLTAPVIAIPLADPAAYVERYAEPDKARSGLGESADAWPTPYWTVDAAMSVMTLLLAAEDAGLGALLFGVFNGEDSLRTALEIPDRLQVLGAIALGWPRDHIAAGTEDRTGDLAKPGLSASRRRRRPAEVIHHGGW